MSGSGIILFAAQKSNGDNFSVFPSGGESTVESTVSFSNGHESSG